MQRWEQHEYQMATTSTTISTRTMKRKQSQTTSSTSIPSSLNLWSPQKGQKYESSSSSGSLSTLGLHQMQGYENLESMQQAPMQWADDEDRSHRKALDPVSTIAFPVANEAGEALRDLSQANRKDGNRYTSLPMQKGAPPTDVQQRLPRHSIVATRLQESSSRTHTSAENSRESSASSSPEGSVATLGPMSLRQRSIKSLQGIASSWVPAAVRSPYESESEAGGSLIHKDKGKEEEKRPIRLDQRRLQKAVSLAVEAAQASEQDNKAWKQKKKRLARQQLLLEQGSAGSKNTRFASLPWKRSQKTSFISNADPKEGALVPVNRQQSDFSSDDDTSSQGTKRAGFRGEDSDESEEMGEEEEEEVDDDFSVDLYISSLGYLLAALTPRDAESVGDKHREEMKRKLEEALKNLEKGDVKLPDSSDREEVIQLRVERELALLEQAYYQRREQSPGVSRARQAAQASSQRSRKQSVAGYLTSSVIDLGLSLGAGALAAASRGVAGLLPILTPDEKPKSSQEGYIEELEVDNPASVSIYSSEKAALVEDSQTALTRSQWDLTRTLAHSVASTMYSNLAAVAEQRRQDPNMPREIALYGQTGPPLLNRQDDASDQLLIMAATLARNVKRSPLPSQIRALTSQVVSLIGALDQRYSLSKRSADVALRKTGQALYYVRKNDLHVKALRAAWAIVEASVAAVEAYRDEEEWKGEVTSPLPPKIEAKPVV